jgi:hypothetical protein
MKISELIDELYKVKVKHGDLEIADIHDKPFRFINIVEDDSIGRAKFVAQERFPSQSGRS